MDQPTKPTYTVAEVCALLGMSRRTVVRIFEKEPGVLALSTPEELHKRRYRSLRIPRSVVQRVICVPDPEIQTLRRDGRCCAIFLA